MRDEAEPAEPSCPPHRWEVGALVNGVETWTCAHCQEQRILDRKTLQKAPPGFTVGNTTPRPTPKASERRPE